MGICICILVGVCGNLGDGSGVGWGGGILLPVSFLLFSPHLVFPPLLPSLLLFLFLPHLLLFLFLPHLLLFPSLICSSFSPSLICSS